MKNSLKDLIDEILSGIAFIILTFLIIFGGAYIMPILDLILIYNM